MLQSCTKNESWELHSKFWTEMHRFKVLRCRSIDYVKTTRRETVKMQRLFSYNRRTFSVMIERRASIVLLFVKNSCAFGNVVKILWKECWLQELFLFGELSDNNWFDSWVNYSKFLRALTLHWIFCFSQPGKFSSILFSCKSCCSRKKLLVRKEIHVMLTSQLLTNFVPWY